MEFIDWFPAISTTSLFAFALWLLRSIISTRLTRSVQHEFDKKIETLRMNLRNSEESFKADLRAKETQIEILRSGAMSGLVSRQAALDRRRIDAVDQLWTAVTALGSAKAASAWMASLKFEAAAQEAARNPQFREMFAALRKGIDFKDTQSSDAQKARPFVSEIAWAMFRAYQAIVFLGATKLHILETGIDAPNILDKDAIAKLIQLALPHQEEYIQKYGDSAYHYLLEELETRLLKELRKILQGVESDKASIEQAAAILKESERLMVSISESAPT